MLKYWLILAWMTLVVTDTLAETDRLIVQPDTKRLDLADYTHTWVDPQKDTTWQQALARFHGQGFTLPQGVVPNIGYSPSTLWVAAPIDARADSQAEPNFDAMLEFRYPALDYIELWLIHKGRVVEHFIDGDQVPDPTVTEPTLTPSFPFRLAYNEGPYLVLARLHSEGSVQAPMTLWEEKHFFRQLPLKNFSWGIFYGILVFALVFNLFLWFSTRRAIYPPYLVFVLGVTACVALLNGHGRYLLGQSIAIHLVPWAPQFGFLALFGLVVFTQRVLNTRSQMKRLHYLLNLTLVANLLPILFGHWLGYRLESLLIAADLLWLMIICLAAAVFSIRHQRRVALFYLTSWAPFLAALLLFMGRNLGWLPSSFVTQHALSIGLVLAVVLLSLVIADSLKQAETAARKSAVREQEALRALAQNQKLATERALKDPVTGLPNKAQVARCFETRFAESVKSVNLVIFRPINQRELLNTLGEANVDLLIQTAAQRLESLPLESFGAIPFKSDNGLPRRLAQVEGRNFLIILEPQVGPDRLNQLAQQAEEVLNEPIALPGLDIAVQYRLGSVNFPTDGQTFATLVRKAQVAVDQAIKRRSSHAHYQPAADPYQPERLLLAYRLKQAIRQNELELHFQPQMRLDDQSVYGLEALVRWPQANGPPISPAEFIPIAERTGLIGALTDWVIGAAIEASQTLQQSGAILRLSVNLSAHDVIRPEFPRQLAERLHQGGIQPACFAVEITESMLIEDWAPAIANLHALRKAGIKVSLDDFGTGYSTLSYLHSLPIDCLKIDQNFVQRMEGDASAEAIISTIIQLAESFGMSVIAEGVESGYSAQRLQLLGCESIQGYWLARPMPLEALVEWLASRQSGGLAAKYL